VRTKTLIVAVVAVLMTIGTVQADVFNLGGVRNPATGAWTGVASLSTVPVGNPGNAADMRYNTVYDLAHGAYGRPEGYGAVSYAYNIGKYEVTAGQYTAFLNAVAKTDAYALYNTDMANTSYGSGITQSGPSGNYAYAVDAAFINRPVNYVSWGDAARFANWLSNSQPTTGVQNASTTERGVYTLDGAVTDAALMAVSVPSAATRATWASGTTSKWLLTSEDEWYKAAYSRGGSTNAGYWDYPTGTNTGPGQNMADPSGNNANHLAPPYTNPMCTTVVGRFQNSPSPYGTFDQGGNVWEWNERNFVGSARGMRGGSFNEHLEVAFFDGGQPSSENTTIGFRVSQVPEPASMSLLALGGIGMLFRRRGLRG